MAISQLPEVPGYEVLQQLRCGGQGIVYRALQAATGRHVALKIIRPELLTDPSALRRFRSEGQAAARLQHQNIITLFDMGQEAGTHFLIMEFIEGVDLHAWVQRFGPMQTSLACDCIRQAALGLQHASEHGLIHRDLKPSNLIRRSSDGVVKILDFGCARLQQPSDAAGTASITATGSFLGTADFIAPEQIENPSRVDGRVDLYSLGCTLYYLLTAQVPFPDESLMRKLDGHRWHWPTPLDRKRPDVPAAVASVCRRLMAKNPEDRFATPLELADTLDTVMIGLEPPMEIGVPSDSAFRTDADSPGVAEVSSVDSRRFPPGYVGECRTFRGHRGYLSSVAFTPSAQKVLSSGLDGEVCISDVETSSVQHVLDGHESGVWSVRVARGGDRFFSGGSDRTVRVWDLSTGQLISRIALAISGEIDNVAISPDGHRALLCCGDGQLRMWDLQRNVESYCLDLGPKKSGFTFNGITFSADGQRVACGTVDGYVMVRDVASGRLLCSLAGHAGPVFSVDISADGCWLTSGGHDGTIRLWDLTQGREVHCFAGHQFPVRGVALAADCQRLMSVSNDQTVRLWDIAGAELCRLEGHTDHVTCVAFSADGGLAVTGSNDRTVRLWKLPASTA
jgi:serine/threonine protein kinase